MNVQVKHGVDGGFEITVSNGATVGDVLRHPDVVTICGELGAARIDGAEVDPKTTIREGDVIEPMSVANEKATVTA